MSQARRNNKKKITRIEERNESQIMCPRMRQEIPNNEGTGIVESLKRRKSTMKYGE